MQQRIVTGDLSFAGREVAIAGTHKPHQRPHCSPFPPHSAAYSTLGYVRWRTLQRLYVA